MVFSALSGWEVFDGTVDKTESGWDVLSAVYVKDYGTFNIAPHTVANEWNIGQQLSAFGNFWAVKIKPKCLGAGIWAVDITANGLSAERPLKVNLQASVDQQSRDDVDTGVLYGVADVAVLEAAPVIEAEYIQIGGVPPTVEVGTAGTPPISMTVRDSVWTTLADPRVHIPNGWVLQDLPVDKIPGQSVWLIKEVWKYVFEFSP